MKIGIFISVTKNSGGIYQYSSSILKALYNWNTDHEFVTIKFTENEFPIAEFTAPNWSNVTIDPRMAYSKNAEAYLCGDGLDLKQSGINPEAEKFFKEHRIDLLIFPAPVSLSFEWGMPYIMAIHDLQHRLQPEFPEVSAGNIWKSREYLFRNGSKFAEAILTDSEVGKEDVLNFYGDFIAPDRIHQLPFLPFYRPDGTEITEAGRQLIKKKYKLPEDFLFYPAQFWLHKNHSRLIHAIQRLRVVYEIDAPLVLVGSNSVGLKEEAREVVYKNAMILAEQLGVQDLVRHLGYVSDEDMPMLYDLSKALVMPTFFGPTNIPVLEAWAFGCPVITSDIRGIREQIGDAGLLVDPKNSSAIANGVLKIWSDKALRDDLVQKGFQRVNSYTARDFSNKLYKIIEGVQHQLESNSSPSRRIEIENMRKITEKHSNSNRYLVSAIVSTYNSERFIRGCLEDLENQTIADRLEIIVIKSGSQQNEEKIIKEFQGKYSNIKYIKTNQRETVYAAWNRGIKAAQGKYITNANTDDRHRRDAFEVMVNKLEALPEISLVYADLIITETENELFENCTPVGVFNWLNFNREDLLTKGCFVGPQPMWRREVHDEYGYFDESFVTSGDYEFWLRISQTRKFMHFPVRLGLYLRSPGSIEHSNREKQREENNIILNTYKKAKTSGKIIRRLQVRSSGDQVKQRSGYMKSPEAIYRNIQTGMENKQPQAVIIELEMLVKTHPEFALAYNDLGALYYQTDNREKAHQFYEKAVRLDPENMVFQKNLADFYYVEMGRVEDALQIYVKLLEANPGDVETLLITGHICVSLHKFEDAKVFYRRVLELEAWNEDARNNLVKLDQMQSIRPELKSPEEMYQEIQPFLNNGDPHRSIASLENLLQRFPEFAAAHNDLGVLFYHTGDKEKAQRCYERAVELMPDNINFQKNLADFYCVELGRIEDALQIYVSILKTDPQDIETLLATGQICKALEKFEDAEHFFKQVLEIEPWNADARNQIEEMEKRFAEASLSSESAEDAYRKIQEKLNILTPAEAIIEFEGLVERYPDFAAGHSDLAVLCGNTGDKEKALHHYQQAARLRPQNMILQKILADFLFVELGKMEEALQIYLGILETHPDNVEGLLITGHICVALKKLEDAKDFYERVLALEPDNEDAGKNLQAIIKQQIKELSARLNSLNDEIPSASNSESADLYAEAPEKKDVEHKITASIVISLDGIQNRVKECLKSIQGHTKEPHELLLVTRGTTKGILKWAQQLVKDNHHYHIIECDGQIGWAECINHAILKAGGDIVVLMHNDVVLSEGWLNAFVRHINFEPDCGVVGPMSNRTAGIQQIAHSDESDRAEFETAAKAFYEQNQYRRVATPKLSDCLPGFPTRLDR